MGFNKPLVVVELLQQQFQNTRFAYRANDLRMTKTPFPSVLHPTTKQQHNKATNRTCQMQFATLGDRPTDRPIHVPNKALLDLHKLISITGISFSQGHH